MPEREDSNVIPIGTIREEAEAADNESELKDVIEQNRKRKLREQQRRKQHNTRIKKEYGK